VNPLLPAGYDIAWAVAMVLIVSLAVVALVSIARQARGLSSTQALVWTVVVIVVPVLGSLAWLLIGRMSSGGEVEAAPER
jgi:hypothetical protein